jgi:hypothetical protein
MLIVALQTPVYVESNDHIGAHRTEKHVVGAKQSDNA